jgi:hypothetical protein
MDSRTLDYTLHANKADLWITLHGEEALVIKNIRELYFQFLQNDECSWLKVSKSSKIDDTASYSIYMRNTNIKAMEKVFWFLGKILGGLPTNHFGFLKFTDIMVVPCDGSNGHSTEPLSKCLHRALTTAGSRLNEPLTFRCQDIHSDDYHIPCGLWTRDEAEEDQKVREAINEYELDVRLPTSERWPHFFYSVSRTVQQTFSALSLDEPLSKKFP